MLFEYESHDSNQHVQDGYLCEESRPNEVDRDQYVLKDHLKLCGRFESFPASVESGIEIAQNHPVLKHERFEE